MDNELQYNYPIFICQNVPTFYIMSYIYYLSVKTDIREVNYSRLVTDRLFFFYFLPADLFLTRDFRLIFRPI